MRDFEQCEIEVLAAIGKLFILNLEGRDEVARSIFYSLVPEFVDRYPHHKILTHLLLQHVKDDESNSDEQLLSETIEKKQSRRNTFPHLMIIK